MNHNLVKEQETSEMFDEFNKLYKDDSTGKYEEEKKQSKYNKNHNKNSDDEYIEESQSSSSNSFQDDLT